MDQKRMKRRPPVRGDRRPEKKVRKEKRPEPVHAPAQEVVYTAPDPISVKRLVLGVVTVAAVVLALFLACTLFFKVEEVRVSGNVIYDEWTVLEAAGIEQGDSLLTFGKGKACARIAQKLPYVKIVRIGITLPNKVNIYIEELDVVYAAQDAKDGWWLLTSSGRVVENVTASVAKEKTKLEGFRIQTPGAVGENAQAVQTEPEDGSEDQPITVTDQDRMDTALSIVTVLERRGILDKVTTVNVSDLGDIVLRYDNTCEVLLGDKSQMEKKLDLMCSAIRTREAAGESLRGIMDASLEIHSEGVSFKTAD
jgi:cell division septal protein FtsQ